MDFETLRERARIVRETRAFFDRRDYLETDTPLLSPDLIPESCLEVFETLRLPPKGSREEAQVYWLIPSPEIWMKRLIAQYGASVYQICKCFRNGESSGFQHSPEFTMLEYYTVGANCLDSLELTEELFAHLLETGNRNRPSAGRARGAAGLDLSPPFRRISVEEAFERWAGFDLYRAASVPGAMEAEARRLGLNPPPGLSPAELYDLAFIHAVEPRLKEEGPVFLTDYPAFVPCLAKKSPGGKTFERWELYAGGIELANCFSEETDPEEVRRFFESERALKEKNAQVRHKVDGDYWKIFGTARAPEGSLFPRCSGVALGLDRLVMVLCGCPTIDGALPFPMEKLSRKRGGEAGAP